MKKTAIILAVVIALCAVLCACGSSGEASKAETAAKPLSEVWTTIKSEVTFEDFNEFDDVKKLKRYYGITEDMISEYAGGVNGSGVNQEEIVLVKAADDTNAAAIKEKLDNRFNSKLNQNKNYNAEQAKMIEGCKVEQNGLYLSMIVSDNAEQITKIYKEGIGV
ncbi:MAG: DUF4358 domain-containing protein [Ruminococcus sp.]|nr:DUF4358 domain-containing protein [Ruminococcus sp.]